jgi:CPA2 family monovalent cation:H+ antiporter-2
VELSLLSSIVVIFGLSIAVVFLFNSLRIPAIVGFILTGLLVGPHGLSLIGAIDQVETLSEIGIILLLFTIGLEFSFKSLWNLRKNVLFGGSVQIALTAVPATLICLLLNFRLQEAILIGFLVALSSTAIVLRLLQERGEVGSPHGGISLGVLIFQDLAVLPMMLALPFLAGVGVGEGESLSFILARDIAILGFLVVMAKWLVPFLFFQIARTRNRELFLLFVVLICIGVAWLTSIAGLSLALGALLAGLIISESEYSSQAIGNIIPFRDVFMSFFFVSIGMLVDLGFLFEHLGVIFAAVIAVFLGKMVIGALVPALLGYPLRTAILVGLALPQVGEFSFILSRSGIQLGLLSRSSYQIFLAVALITMAATPFLIALGPRIVQRASSLSGPDRWKRGSTPEEHRPPPLRDHIIIVGYGVNGRNLSRAARIGGIPYIILEMNPETVRLERARGEPITYGDATNQAILMHAGIEEARILVVVINDPVSTRRITDLARTLNTRIYIIVRTRYIQEMKPLYELGADEVIPEEFETSVEIFTRVLKKYLIPRETIEKFITEVRADNYQMLRSLTRTGPGIRDLMIDMPDIEISTFNVAEGAPVAERTLAEINLRRRYAVTVVAIERKGQVIPNPGADVLIQNGDRVIALGTSEQIAEAAYLFQASEQGEKK